MVTLKIIATLRCSKDEPAVEIEDSRQLDDWLDRLAARCSEEFPGVYRFYGHGYEVEIGLGLPEGFVHVEHESGLPPYYTTLGDESAAGEVPFYLFGDHRTVIDRRHLIPVLQARQVLHEFMETGSRPATVRWEKETGY